MIKRIKTISDFHRLRNLPPPEHPLISVVDVSAIRRLHPDEPTKCQVDVYIIALSESLTSASSFMAKANTILTKG